jgi:hypothetical protein
MPALAESINVLMKSVDSMGFRWMGSGPDPRALQRCFFDPVETCVYVPSISAWCGFNTHLP